MSKKSFTCPNCQSVMEVPKLIHMFTVPDDYAPIVDLIEARFNVVNCWVCKRPFAIPAPVAVLCHTEKAAIVHVPLNVDPNSIPQHVTRDYTVHVCHNYYDLYLSMLPWLNKYLHPIFGALFSESYRELGRAQQIELFSPLFLRLFKGYLDKKVPLILEAKSEASPEEFSKGINGEYISVVYQQLSNIMLEACRTSSLLQLEELIRGRVPKDCITSDVLSLINDVSKGHDRNLTDSKSFMFGFRQEYLQAVIYAYLGVNNPRGVTWGSYIRSVWELSKNENIVFDRQFHLPHEVLHRTLTFGDLWNAGIKFDSTPGSHEVKQLGEMMIELGYGDQYVEMMRGGAFKFQIDETDAADLFAKNVKELYPLNQSAAISEDFGQGVGMNLTILVSSSDIQYVVTHARSMMSYAIEASDWIAAVSTASHSAEVLNRYSMMDESASLIDVALSILEKESLKLSQYLAVHFYNEVASIYRFRHEYQLALDTYLRVAELLDNEPESEVYVKNKRVLFGNVAIVYRQMGRFTESIALISDLLQEDPNNHMFRHTAALVYAQLNLYTQALEHISHAIELVTNSPHVVTRTNYLITRGWLRHQQGDNSSGIRDLMTAFRDTPDGMIDLTSRIAAGAMSFTADSEAEQSFIDKCVGLLEDRLKTGEYRNTPSLHVTMLAQLGSRLLRLGMTAQARTILEPEIQWFQEDPQAPQPAWELSHVAGWLYYQLDQPEKCWTFIKAAISKLAARMPSAEDSSFAIFWLQDKEAFQQNVASMALDFANRGLISIEEMLAVYEIMNGWEIRAKLSKADDIVDSDFNILNNLIEFAKEIAEPFEVFFFIDTVREIRVVRFSSQTKGLTFVDSLKLNTADVLQIKERTLSALKKANPADLSVLDQKLVPWQKLSHELGSLLASCIPAGAHVYILPGRIFTGMPLHSIQMPGGDFLLERHTVSYSANSKSLLATKPIEKEERKKTISVVTVTKEHDSHEYKKRANTVSERLLRQIEHTAETIWLKEESADLNAVRLALTTCAEIVFICHGTRAGLDKGFGICIAADGHLPPTFLPVSEVPELSRFILNWTDIDGIEKSPELVVSLACSTGQTQIGRGGVRLGLEQSLFSSGTKMIVSPLWDVEQSSALDWVEIFYGIRSQHPNWTIEQAVREASLKIKKTYIHEYFWAPYFLNGAIQKETI